jgi:hypothetical protein
MPFLRLRARCGGCQRGGSGKVRNVCCVSFLAGVAFLGLLAWGQVSLIRLFGRIAIT